MGGSRSEPPTNSKIMIKKIFEQELAQCKKLHKENNGQCNWGKCDTCGVIPFLYKLYKGQLIEDENEIKKIKNKLFK